MELQTMFTTGTQTLNLSTKNISTKNISTKFLLSYVTGLACFLPYFFLVFVDPNLAVELGNEDGLIENLGAGFFALASLTLFFTYIQSAKTENKFFNVTTKRNIWYLLLCIFLFLCFGEEISWGQRIFNWQTPDLWVNNNVQQETNIHNLGLFEKSDILNFTRLLTLFCMAYGFLFPILVRFFKQYRTFSQWLGLPIPSIAIGSFFIVNYIFFRLISYSFDIDQMSQDAFKELHESYQPLIFFVLSLYFFFNVKAGNSVK